jgi:dihydroflavonol-4-reductase
VRVFLTGGTGFLGRQVARKLRERGDSVVALARSPERGRELARDGCELVQGDLADEEAIRRGVQGCDGVIHVAAVFKVGIPKSERPAMWDAGVRGTERVFDAAAEAGVRRVVYVSTVMVFGNTHGRVLDESYVRPDSEAFMSCYEETKHKAHEVALERIEAGAPIVIVQPGGIYGPGDESDMAGMVDQARNGKLKAKVFPESGGTFVHVEDAADGILLAMDRGKPGESYILGGESSTLGDVLDGGRALRPQAGQGHRAPGAGVADGAAGAPDRQASRPSPEPPGGHPLGSRHHLLVSRRQGSRRARLHPARSRFRTA